MPIHWSCVHVNHGLRGDQSQEDEGFCRELCSKYSVRFQAVSAPVRGGSNLQDRARALRYKAIKSLAQPGVESWTVTGHHQDDSLESLLIGLHQGRHDERLEPLKMIHLKRRVYRPFCRVSRMKITETCSQMNCKWREDGSNISTKYLRNYYRHSKILNISKKALLRLSQELSRLSRERDVFFTEFLQNQPLPSMRSDGEIFRISKKAFLELSPQMFQGFWFWFLSQNHPQFMQSLDLKRLLQAQKPGRKNPRCFSLSKSSEHKLVLEETPMDFVLTTEPIIHTNSTPNTI